MGPTLLAYGTEEQKQQFLPGILSRRDQVVHRHERARRRLRPRVASHPRRSATATSYVINGQKIWTSFGETADYCYLICRTSTDGPPHAGISELIVPMDTPGIAIRPIKDMTTNRHFCEVFFTDVRVPAANLVGEEGGSFKQTMRQLEHERGGIDRLLSNHALYQMRSARRRHDRPDRPPGDRRARDRLPHRPPARAPRGAGAGAEVVLGRDEDVLHRARAARRRLRRARRSAPTPRCGDGWRKGSATRPAYTIMGGTSNVLRNILGERVLALPREPA